MKTKNGLPPIHPGEIIKEDLLPSAGLSVTAAAKALGVSRQMLHDILAGGASRSLRIDTQGKTLALALLRAHHRGCTQMRR